MSAHTYIKSGKQEFDELTPRIQRFPSGAMDMVIDEKHIRGYRSPDTPAVWLRDHSDMMRLSLFRERSCFCRCISQTPRLAMEEYSILTVQPKVPCERWSQHCPCSSGGGCRVPLRQCALAWQSTGRPGSSPSSLALKVRRAAQSPWRWDPKSS